MNPRAAIDNLKLQGSPNLRRAMKYAPITEKKFRAGVPDAPKHLSADEREVWDRVVALLGARGTVTAGDVFVIERYAALYVRWRTEKEALGAEGTVVEVLRKLGKDHAGVYVSAPNPRLRVVQATERQLLALDIELGLTPRHRGEPGETHDPLSLDELLNFSGGPQ